MKWRKTMDYEQFRLVVEQVQKGFKFPLGHIHILYGAIIWADKQIKELKDGE